MWLKMSFQSSKTIEQALDDIKDAEPTLVIDCKTSSKSDIFKYQFCQEFVKFLKAEKITQTELAKKLKVDKEIINMIVHHKIDSFTIDHLVKLLSPIRSLELSFKVTRKAI